MGVRGLARFQSTPPRGGRLDRVMMWLDILRVSIHAPARGATHMTDLSSIPILFQSTPPRGGRPPAFSPAPWWRCFNPRPRAGGDAASVSRRATRTTGFNPRPRAGGDFAPKQPPNVLKSFNPRPRAGGDRGGSKSWRADHVSIHAPARGATGRNTMKDEATTTFQSTPPRGGRPFPWACLPLYEVSIHAPARGATVPAMVTVCVEEFQSTPPRGGRPIGDVVLTIAKLFQSTPPRGGRLIKTVDPIAALVFQSTPPRGGRRDAARACRDVAVSIHAPARGATPRATNIGARYRFQSTPPRGGRPQRRVDRGYHDRGFNPRPRAGGDTDRAGSMGLADVSIHAPARGAT